MPGRLLPRAAPDAMAPVTPQESGGPMVAVCQGHRCAGLRRLTGTAGQMERIRETVRATPGAVLVSSSCWGRCESAALVAVARRDGAGGRTGPTVWLSGVEQEDRAAALSDWIAAGGPQRLHEPEHGLPPDLGAAVIGFGPPASVVRGGR